MDSRFGLGLTQTRSPQTQELNLESDHLDLTQTLLWCFGQRFEHCGPETDSDLLIGDLITAVLY